MTTTPYENESRRLGRELADFLTANGTLNPVPTSVALQPGEECFGATEGELHQLLEADGSYEHHTRGVRGGGVIGLAADIAVKTGTAIGNERRRQEAERYAALQWRAIDQGPIFITNERFCVQGKRWHDIWFRDIRMSDCDGFHIVLEIGGESPSRIGLPYSDYWYTLFRSLAYDQIVYPPYPDDSDDNASTDAESIAQSPPEAPLQPRRPPASAPEAPSAPAGPSTGLSTASLVLGLLSLVLGFTFFIPLGAVILGAMGVQKEPTAKGRAVAGLVIGGGMLLIWLVIFLSSLHPTTQTN